MFWSFVNVEVLEDGVAELCLWEHTLNGMFNDSDRLSLQLFLDGTDALTTWVASVVNIVLFIHLVTSQDDLLCIDNDDIIRNVVGADVALPKLQRKIIVALYKNPNTDQLVPVYPLTVLSSRK